MTRLSPSVAGVHHVTVAVSNLGQSMAFYVELLGLSPLPRPPLRSTGAWLQAGAVQLHLIETAPEDFVPSPAILNGRNYHLAFEIADYETALQQLRAMGAEVVEGGSGITQMFLRDPDGYIVELIRP